MARTETVPKARFAVYLRRAEDFASQMEQAAASQAWNSVGLLAIHSTISSCDALTVFHAGQRWSGQDHAGLRHLVESLGLPNSAGVLRQISNILSLKNRVEYESREFLAKEAKDLQKEASRVLAWVRLNLPQG